MSQAPPDTLTPLDIRNGKMLYRRPMGNRKPDNDPRPTGTASSIVVRTPNYEFRIPAGNLSTRVLAESGLLSNLRVVDILGR